MKLDNKKIGYSLAQNIFMFICITFLLIIIPLFYTAKSSLTDFGEYVNRVNLNQIGTSARYYLSSSVADQAKTYDQIFEKISTASSLMGKQLFMVYQQLEGNEKISSGWPVIMKQNPGTGMYYASKEQGPIIAYWGGAQISPMIQSELSALTTYLPTLIKAKEKITESLATHVITQSGVGVYHTHNIAARRACFNLPDSSQFDLRDGEPVTLFTKSDWIYNDTRWTRIYRDDVIDGLMITASTPVYDSKGDFRAITGIDIPVKHLIKDLMKKASTSGEGDQGGILFSFLINRNGNIIAFPEPFFDLFKFDFDFAELNNSADIFNYTLEDTKDPAIGAAARKIQKADDELIDLVIGNETYLMAVEKLHTVQWRFVSVARERDLMASVYQTQTALKESQSDIWHDFLAHSTLSLVVCFLIVVMAIRFFITPIRELIFATKKVAKGDFSVSVDTSRKDELGLLAESFNTMIEKLKISEAREQHHARELENRISLRTSELRKSNEALNRIKDSLEKTVTKRTAQLRELNDHLVNTEETERKAIASDLHDSVTQTLAMAISRLKDIRERPIESFDDKLDQVQSFVEQSVREIRSLIYQLSPPVLDDFEIELALGFLVEDFNKKHHARIAYINKVDVLFSLDQSVKVTMYRAVNELISNIFKHADTKKAEISISLKDKTVQVLVSDQGNGFTPDAVEMKQSRGFGLKSLSQRIQNFGGTMAIRSAPGTGTDVFLTLPIKKHK